jgi:stress response protein YsnF
MAVSQTRTVYVERQTTSSDRTVLVPFENRKVYIERQTTSAERTVRVAA